MCISDPSSWREIIHAGKSYKMTLTMGRIYGADQHSAFSHGFENFKNGVVLPENWKGKLQRNC